MKKTETSNHKGLNRTYIKAFALVAALFIAIAVISGCSSNQDPQALYEEKCSTCHSLEVTENANYTGEEWNEVVQRMADMTSSISDGEADQIAEYLKETRG